MRKICTANFWLGTLASLLLSCAAYGAVSKEQVKKRMIGDLNFVKNVFEVKYAPKQWKQEFANWDLDYEIETAKSKVLSLSNPTVKDFQVILKQFFNSAKDYHVSVRYYSTERAVLPFTIKGAEDKYFITHIDRDKLPLIFFPAHIGDEITEFNHQPISKVIEELKKQEFGSNTPETDQALAELALTTRRGDTGDIVPQGTTTITVKNKEGKSSSYNLKWDYFPEKIRDFSNLGSQMNAEASIFDKDVDVVSAFKNSDLFKKIMVTPLWDKPIYRPSDEEEENFHVIGSRKSYIPNLGKKTWQSSKDFTYDAYIFNSEAGKRIGYVRIAHYMADDAEAEDFRQLMEYFKKQTDALVIDQINNPGGSVFYLYALASMLTDKPLYTPKHRMALTQEEVYMAVSLLPVLEMIKDDATAQSFLGETMGGYPVSMEFVRLMTGFCKFLISEWNSGNTYTKPFYIFGINEVNPHPQTRYTKPILVLVNSLDFSGGDFFPAILQDNQRAQIFGTRTAGAGGYVLATQFPNQMGIKGFHMTGSLAERINHQPIENLGVTPSKIYKLSQNDLQNNYVDYVKAINNAINEMVK